MNLIDSK